MANGEEDETEDAVTKRMENVLTNRAIGIRKKRSRGCSEMGR